MNQFYQWRSCMLSLLLLCAATGKLTAQTGTALNFDGVDDVIQVPISPHPDYTVEARIMFTGSVAGRNIICYTQGDPTTSWANQIRTDAAGHFEHDTYDGTARIVVGTTVAQPNVWYHVSITGRSNGDIRLYVNGVMEGTPVAVNTLWQYGASYSVGSVSGGNASAFQGNMDELRIWGCELSAAQIANGVGCSADGPQPSLIRSFPFNQGIAGGNNSNIYYAYDYSGNNAYVGYYGFAVNGSTSNWVAPAGTLSTSCTPIALPEINVTGKGLNILSGVTYTDINNDTYWGTVLSGTAKTFTIQNTGSLPLHISNATITGTDFTFTTPPPATIAGNSTATFTVALSSTQAGAQRGRVHIYSDDCDEPDYDFPLEAYAAAGGSLDFDGTDDYVQLPSAAASSENGFTTEAWVYWKGGAADQHLLELGTGAGSSLYLTPANSSTGTVRMAVTNGAATQTLDGTAALTQNTWHHIAVTMSTGGVWTLYVDGLQQARAGGYTTPVFTGVTTDSWLGRSAAGVYFNGRLDEVRFWSRDLCAATIQNNMNCELYRPYESGIHANLISYYTFDQGAGNSSNSGITTLYDARAGHNATLMNFSLSGNSSNFTGGAVTNGTTCLLFLGSAVNDSSTAVTQNVSGTTTYFIGCGSVANVSPYGAHPVNGSVTTRVTVEPAVPSYQGHAYVQRHYDITPANDPANATANVTLYFTQQEFDQYNAVNGNDADLPTGPNDITGKNNLRITQYHGTGTVPGSYSGSTVILTPYYINYTNRWEISFEITGFSGFTVAGLAATNPLPVKLVGFHAAPKPDHSVVISWDVALQQQVKQYVVERSADGSSFRPVATAAAVAATAYSVLDESPLPGWNYYRLRIEDRNGSITYSSVEKVQVAGRDAAVSISPVPAAGMLSVTLYDPGLDNRPALLKDMQGRIVRQLVLSSGSNTVSVQELQAGIYTLQLADGRSYKVVKE